MSTAGTIGQTGGQIGGGILGGAIGSVFGPIGTWIGRAIGSKVGGMAGRVAGEALASYMEDANENAEDITRDSAPTQACADCEPPNRRHDPCRTKGNDPTKQNNTVWDPEISPDVRNEISEIRSGKIPRQSGTYTVNGRTYGAHGKALFPQSGPGFINLNRFQHQFLKQLNSSGYDGGMKFSESLQKKGLMTQEEINKVLEIWRKCGMV